MVVKEIKQAKVKGRGKVMDKVRESLTILLTMDMEMEVELEMVMSIIFSNHLKVSQVVGTISMHICVVIILILILIPILVLVPIEEEREEEEGRRVRGKQVQRDIVIVRVCTGRSREGERGVEGGEIEKGIVRGGRVIVGRRV